MTTTPVLAAYNLSKKFGEIEVLQDISFRVDRGEFVTLLGPSGCGKSTILNIISGLVIPDSGMIKIREAEVTGETGHVSYMQQKDLLLPWRKVIDNVSLPLRLQGIPKMEAREKAAPFMDEFGLGGFEYSYPHQLSGGMRQRAALLRTYLFSKDILLLDEPFAGIDAMTKEKLHRWFMETVDRLKLTVLLVTHDIDEALALSDRLHVLSDRPAKIVLSSDLTGLKGSTETKADLKNKIITALG